MMDPDETYILPTWFVRKREWTDGKCLAIRLRSGILVVAKRIESVRTGDDGTVWLDLVVGRCLRGALGIYRSDGGLILDASPDDHRIVSIQARDIEIATEANTDG